MFLKILASSLLLSASLISCQTVTLPPPTSLSVKNLTFTWKAPVAGNGFLGCAATESATTTVCSYKLYRIPGVCPSPVIGSSGWTEVLSTASGQLTATDTTALPNTQYSWVVEGIVVSNSNNGAPSNCVTYTTPAATLVPNVPTTLSD